MSSAGGRRFCTAGNFWSDVRSLETEERNLAYRFLADLAVLVHLTFIVFALMGGILVSRWHLLAWLHIPAVAWIALNQCLAWDCPLTLAEKWFRQRVGVNAYREGFVSHYLVQSPGAEDSAAKPMVGLLIIVLNGALYWWIAKSTRKAAQAARDHSS